MTGNFIADHKNSLYFCIKNAGYEEFLLNSINSCLVLEMLSVL
jgi:hypothetical protein